jgi:DASH complex subunit DAD3
MSYNAAGCTPVEKEVLAEYARLIGNIDKVRFRRGIALRKAETRRQLADLAQELSLMQPALLEQLRPLERKLGLVFTLFKASVFASLRAQQAREEEAEAAARAAEAADDSDNSF